MRKMILALVVVMLTAPAWANVQISVEDEGNGVAAIKYDSTGETELVRAFALDIAFTAGDGVITDVTDFAVGDDNGGYGIFPANFSRFITVDGQTGEVADWGVAGYTPVADANDTGAAGALGGPAITIEMGSLYDTMAPGTTGTLCKIAYEGSGTVEVTANAVRGGIVLENAAQAVLDSTPTEVGGGGSNFPTDNPAYNDWVLLGEPACWCASDKGGSGYQCDGDADGQDSGFPARYRVYLGDLNVLIANWQKKAGDATLDPCADIDHKDSGFPARYRVYLNDLNIVIANWQKKDAALAGDCPR